MSGLALSLIFGLTHVSPFPFNESERIVAALLIQQQTPTEAPPNPERWRTLSPALQAVAISWQIMDERERHYLFSKRDDFNRDLEVVRFRYKELKNVEMIEDANRFPYSTSECRQLCSFNRKYYKTIVDRMQIEFDRAPQLSIVKAETQYLYDCWDALSDIKQQYYFIHARRQAIVKLKYFIGEENYKNGVMPDIVPTWRFNELK